jgi:hypothetical protein
MMRRRTFWALIGVLLVLSVGAVGCSATQLLAGQSAATVTPTRTPRPTWTPVPGRALVATPTLDATRFPGVVLPTAPPSTPLVLIPGSGQTIFLPQPAGGGPAVQTVVVIIVTATPVPTATPPPGPFVPPIKPTPTPLPGPTLTPSATPLPTNTPLPPVKVITKEQANVRQGPGVAYPVVTKLEAETEVTVVGRNQAGDWWKICCVNGADVWISDALVRVEGPLWTVAEVLNLPPTPAPLPTTAPSPTPAPSPTYAWTFRVEGTPEEYHLGQDIFRVDAVIYNGAVPLWGYKLRIRNVALAQEWVSDESQSAGWDWTIVQWPNDGQVVGNVGLECPNPTLRPGLRCVKSNLKWDSNKANLPGGTGTWEVTVIDRAGNPLSAPVRFATNPSNSKWYYVVFRR